MRSIQNLGWFVLVSVLLTGCAALRLSFNPDVQVQVEQTCAPTPPDQQGPYYIADAPFKARLYPEGTPGETLIISGTVRGANCQPLPGAVVDAWQADASGVYDFSDQFIGRGQVTADEQGRYQFETVLPGEYVPRPPHIHLKISHPDARPLTTQLYFEGRASRGIPSALVIPLEAADGGLRGTFDIVLN